jgi:heptosyltransferase-2
MVKGTNWVGDTILSLPSIQAIKDVFPYSVITVYTQKHLAEIFSHNPYVNEVVSYRRRRGIAGIFDQFKLIDLYRRGNYDVAIILPNSFSSALLPFMARIPVRVGYAREGRSILLTNPITCTDEIRKAHQSHYYMNIVRSLGGVSNSHFPVIQLREDERKWARTIVNGLAEPERRWVVGICPGARYGPAKRWFADRYIELAKRLNREAHAKIFLFGGKEEALEIRIMAKRIGGDCIDMAGKTTLIQMASIMELCDLVISNDSGPMHMGGAMGIPVLAIFGSTDPSITSPLGKAMIIRKEIQCSPCFKRKCPKKTYECLERISVDEVFNCSMEILKGKGI